MNKQEFIEAAFKAQHDAGTEISFNEKVTHAGKNLTNKLTDPVAAFLAHLLDLCNGEPKEAIEQMEFYFKELERVKKHFKPEEKAEGNEISITWCIEDVHERVSQMFEEEGTLTDDEAREVLEDMKHNHDCNYGISWETMDVYIDIIFENRKK